LFAVLVRTNVAPGVTAMKCWPVRRRLTPVSAAIPLRVTTPVQPEVGKLRRTPTAPAGAVNDVFPRISDNGWACWSAVPQFWVIGPIVSFPDRREGIVPESVMVDGIQGLPVRLVVRFDARRVKFLEDGLIAD
jgi:hypothetical protein